jgi:hypothetical protein
VGNHQLIFIGLDVAVAALRRPLVHHGVLRPPFGWAFVPRASSELSRGRQAMGRSRRSLRLAWNRSGPARAVIFRAALPIRCPFEW